MDKEVFAKSFIENLNKNYSEFSQYFDIKSRVFRELDTIIFEINKCLILEFHRAAITLTNHLLERLLKLALINNEVGIGPLPIDQWNTVFSIPNEKYGSIMLHKSIDKCKELGLITNKEWDILYNTIRVMLRNGFSHADSSKILTDLPDRLSAFQGNLKGPIEITEVSLNQNVIPFLQELNIESFAKEASKDYFDFVLQLMINIEKRLVEKNK
jgi:RNAse (barnase) inhibitor barstar